MANPAFWNGKRVFITGHTGFKGGWAALWLHEMGAQVAGYSLPPDTAPNFFTLTRAADGLENHVGDIRDRAVIAAAIRTFAPDLVLHMAAQSLVRRSYAQPVETYATNVMGTVHVLEALREVPGVGAAIIVTSDKCYANDESGRAFGEEDALGGHDPYSSSKGAAELVTAAYAHSFFQQGCRIASARAGNVIGGGDWAEDRLVPDLVRGLLQGTPITIRHPHAVRPWQHVLEPVSGYLLLAEKLLKGEERGGAWNFGPDEHGVQPVEALARKACELWGSPGAFEIAARPSGEFEAHTLLLTSAKAQRKLGWRRRWSFDAAMTRTMDWYRAFARQDDMRAVTLTQIADYTARES